MTGEQPSAAEFWRRYDAVESRLTAPVSERMLELAGLRLGMRVLDLASGRGEPALRAAERVGEQGFVLGVDVSEPLLQMAREKARRQSLLNLEFRAGNAESMASLPAAHFHAATVRWGLTSMAAPVAALATARRALVAEGVLVAALWAEPERVLYYTLPRRLLERYRTVPVMDPDSPGTFRYASVERITRDFRRAGFVIERIEELEVPVIEAETSGALVDWVRGLGLAHLLQELSESDQQAWTADLIRALEQLRTGAVIQLGGTTRLVLARAEREQGASV